MNQTTDKPNILIVDDETAILKILNETLKQNYKIRTSLNGKRAIEITMSDNPPDLILLDVIMPDMDGYDTCAKLKNDPKTKDIPIIFITAEKNPESIVKGFNMGAVDYVTKPFNEEELLARVKTHIALKMQQHQLMAQNIELNRLNATKDKLFSIIAHDLKSPVINFMTFIELMDNMDKNSMDELITFFKNASQNLYNLLENLLTWAMSQRNVIVYKPVFLSLKEIVEANISVLKHQAQNKNITLTNSIPDNIISHGDLEMIKCITRNIMSNALKFTNPGGSIKVNAELTGEKIQVSIADSGKGMSKETIDKLFKIETMSHENGTAGETGTGLGLIICYEFIKRHNGTIWVESQINSGSTFFFTLPVAKINNTKAEK